MITGSQDRWFNSEPAPVQYDNDLYSLGTLSRWFNSNPSPIMGKFVAGNSNTYHVVTTDWLGADTLSLYVDGVLVESDTSV